MAFNQNQVKANSTPNYFNTKNTFNSSDNYAPKAMTPHGLKSTNENNMFFNGNGNLHDDDDDEDHENSVLINSNSNQYQHTHHSESKELIEISNRLGFYINAVSCG